MVRLSIGYTGGVVVVPRALPLLIDVTIATSDQIKLDGGGAVFPPDDFHRGLLVLRAGDGLKSVRIKLLLVFDRPKLRD